MKIGIIASRFNSAITDKLVEGAVRALSEAKVEHDIVRVPGAFEIPLMCLQLAKSKQYDALVALGVVIKGETDHYDIICRACVDGVREVMLTQEIPIAFEVLMVENAELARARAGDRKDNNKGYTGAQIAMEMADAFHK